MQAKDPKVEVQAKDQRLIEVTKEIQGIQPGGIQDLGSRVGFPTWARAMLKFLLNSNLTLIRGWGSPIYSPDLGRGNLVICEKYTATGFKRTVQMSLT